jgi:hypothetical protein
MTGPREQQDALPAVITRDAGDRDVACVRSDQAFVF